MTSKRVSGPPLVLTFAGADPTSGAGLQADLLTVCGMGCHGLVVVTAISVQDTVGISDIMPVSADVVSAQARTILNDMAVSAIYITDERKKVVDFSDSYYAGGLVAMVKEGNTAIKTLADLNGKKVAVQVGTKSVSYLGTEYPKVQLVEVEKNQEMFNLVDIGRADAAVTGKPAAFQYVRTRGGLRVLEQQLTTEEYGMALRKDTPELTRAVNGAVATLRADGTYALIVKKWFSNSAK